MSFANVQPRTPREKHTPPPGRGAQRSRRLPPPPPGASAAALSQLSANEVALLEEEERAAGSAARRQSMPDGPVQVRERPGGAMREQAHERFLHQYTADATQVAEVFAELGQHLEQQQDSLDKVEDNVQTAKDAMHEGLTEYADGAKEKAKYDARQQTMVAGVVGGATAVAAIATGGIALGIAAGAAAVVGGVGAQAGYKVRADAAQGEVEAMEVQQALGPLKDKKDWSPDAEAHECEGCSVAFSMFWRRHHCRSCGGVFCANCAPKQAVRLCNTCAAKKTSASGRKVENGGTSSSSQPEEDSDLMAQWAADEPAAKRRSPGSATPGAVAADSNTVSDRTALLGAGKPAHGKGVSAAEAEALRAAERAAAAGTAAAAKVADQGEQIHGVAGSAKTAAEIAARAERVDQCYSTYGAIKMAWSRGASMVTGEYPAGPEPEPEPEPPQGTVLAKAMYFRVVERVRLDPCFEPPQSSSAAAGGSTRWLEEGGSIQVVESKWIGERVCRMRLLEGGWVTAIANDKKFLRRDRARTQAGGEEDDDVVMQKLAQLTTQNLQTGCNINAALTKQAEELEQIDASATKAAESTSRLNASAANKLAGLGKAPKRGSASTRSV
jgi:hypothetical protein